MEEDSSPHPIIHLHLLHLGFSIFRKNLIQEQFQRLSSLHLSSFFFLCSLASSAISPEGYAAKEKPSQHPSHQYSASQVTQGSSSTISVSSSSDPIAVTPNVTVTVSVVNMSRVSIKMIVTWGIRNIFCQWWRKHCICDISQINKIYILMIQILWRSNKMLTILTIACISNVGHTKKKSTLVIQPLYI